MATTLELPTDIWETIIKQSKMDINDLLKDLSLTELREIVCKTEKQIQDKLRCVRNKYPKYTILNDTNNQKWMVICGSNGRYVACEKVYYTVDTTLLGNYQKNNGSRNIRDIYYYIDLENEKLVNCNCDENTYTDFEIVQYQSDIDAQRISRADNLKIGDTFSYFTYNISMNITNEAWDWRSKQLITASVIKNTPKYITYEEVLYTTEYSNIVARSVRQRKVEKKYVVY